MLRRLLAALLVAAIALPLPALATGGCSMTASVFAAKRCCCDTGDAATTGCASLQGGCGCSLRADTGDDKPLPPLASTQTHSPQFTVDVTLIPATLSTPQTERRAVHLAASPPGAGTVSRPRLCTWII